MSNEEKVIAYIKEHYSIDDINDMIDDVKMDYVDYEQMEDEGIEDEFEFYDNYRTNEAESDVIEFELMKKACKALNIELDIDEHCRVYDTIEEYIK